MPLFSDSGHTESSMYALALCRAKQQTHYDRSPHCRTVSLTGVSSFILAELALFCGVAPLCRDGIMISYFSRRRNGTKRQFLPCAIVYFDNAAVKETLIPQPPADFQSRASHSPKPLPAPVPPQRDDKKGAVSLGTLMGQNSKI